MTEDPTIDDYVMGKAEKPDQAVRQKIADLIGAHRMATMTGVNRDQVDAFVQDEILALIRSAEVEAYRRGKITADKEWLETAETDHDEEWASLFRSHIARLQATEKSPEYKQWIDNNFPAPAQDDGGET